MSVSPWQREEFKLAINGIVAQLDHSQALLFKAYMKYDTLLSGSVSEHKFNAVITEYDAKLKEDEPENNAQGSDDTSIQLSFIEFLDWYNGIKLEKDNPTTTIKYQAWNRLRYWKSAMLETVWSTDVMARFQKLSPENAAAAITTFKELGEEVKKWKEYNAYSDEEGGMMMKLGAKAYKKTAYAADIISDYVAPKGPPVLFEAGKEKESKILAKRACGVF